MKKPILLVTASFFSYLLLTGYSQGLAGIAQPQNRTGAGGSVANCAGSSCHNNNNTNLGLSVSLWDISTSSPVTNGKYKPNTPYMIRIAGNYSAGSGSRPYFSYQLTSESEGIDYGAFLPNQQGLQAHVIGQHEIVEPLQPIASQSNSTFQDTVLWLSPDPGNEDVKIYLTLLAANGDMSINGDITNNTNVLFQEGTTSVADLGDRVKTNLYPNPARDHFSLAMTGAAKGSYTILAYDQKGSVMEKRVITSTGADIKETFNTAAWANGSYYLIVSNGNAQRVIPFVKQ